MNDYLATSRRAAEEARVLLKLGHFDGAVARAYYAMYNAACAALLSLNRTGILPKTHKGLLRQFSREIVLPEPRFQELAKAMRKALKARIEIDYEAHPADLSSAQDIVSAMDKFVEQIAKFIEARKP